ncbi:MAG TPA: peptidoglycan DD-metalloendopeptidase family protein [Thermoanaerobaculia bacterium]
MPRISRIAACALLLSLILPALPAPSPIAPPAPGRGGEAFAAQGGGTTAERRERELAALRAEIARLEMKLEGERRRRTGLRDELAAADLELRLQEVRLAEAMAARDLAARRAAASEREVERLELELDAVRRELRGRLAALYRLGRQGYLRLFLALDPRRPLLPSLRTMRYLARRDRLAFDRYGEARERLAAERDRLLAEREDRESWMAQEAERRQELFAVRTRKAALLARVEKEERALAARAGELAEKERKLSALLDFLYGRSTSILSGAPIQQFRGVLDWPAEGRVTAGFGPRLDPRYRTRVPHNGVDLATTPAAEVKAVFPGKVVYAAPFQGYGNTVVVHHPGRVFTLYAGLSELRKGRGDMVSLSEVVGLASNSLYFEIRVENRPDDPLSWLRASP